MPVDRDALMNDYASVAIPESVRADLEASYFFRRTTLAYDHYGRVDAGATLRNEGARIAFVEFLERIDKARRGKPAAHEQTKAVSATAEGEA